MYNVTQQYLNQLHDKVHVTHISGTIGGVQFTEADISELSITNQCSSGDEMSIGSVYTAELGMTLRSNFTISGDWKGSKIVVSEGLHLTLPNVTEYVPLGEFYVSECNYSTDGINITAYDVMTKFDKAFNNVHLSGVPFDLLSGMCNKCGVELALLQSQMSDFPNGNATLQLYGENDIETYRDLLSWIAMTLGSFATIDRSGKLTLRKYSQSPVDTITEYSRFNSCSFSDFVTNYTGMSVVNLATDSTNYFHVTPDNGLVFNTGSNPLVQHNTGLVQNIIDDFSQVSLKPFKASMLSGALYDLGDCINFTGGIAGDVLCGVMKYSYRFHGEYSIEGFGKDPALASAKSKTDKNLSGLRSNMASKEVNQMITNVNWSSVHISEQQEESLFLYHFEVTEEDNLVFASVNMTIDFDAIESVTGEVYELSDIIAKLRFYVDNSRMYYVNPEFVVDEGTDTISYEVSFGDLTVGPHTFDVRMELDGAEADLDPDGLYEHLWGYGITFEVYVKALQATEHRSTYYVGEYFTLDDMKVDLIYNNGTSEEVTYGCSYDPEIDTFFTQPGAITVNISYQNEDDSYSTAYDAWVSDEVFELLVTDDKSFGIAVAEEDYNSQRSWSVNYPTFTFSTIINGSVFLVNAREYYAYNDGDIVSHSSYLYFYKLGENTQGQLVWEDPFSLFNNRSAYTGYATYHNKAFISRRRQANFIKDWDQEPYTSPFETLAYRNVNEDYPDPNRQYESVYLQSVNISGDSVANELFTNGKKYKFLLDNWNPKATESGGSNVRHNLMMVIGDYAIFPRVEMSYEGVTSGGTSVSNSNNQKYGFAYMLIHDENEHDSSYKKYADLYYVPDFSDTIYKVTEIYDRIINEDTLSNADTGCPFSYTRNIIGSYDYGKSGVSKTYKVEGGKLKLYNLYFNPNDYFTESQFAEFNTNLGNITRQGKISGTYGEYYFIDENSKVMAVVDLTANPNTYVEYSWQSSDDDIYKHSVSNIGRIAYHQSQEYYFYFYTEQSGNTYKHYVAYSNGLQVWHVKEGNINSTIPTQYHIQYDGMCGFTDRGKDYLVPCGYRDKATGETYSTIPYRATLAHLFIDVANLEDMS